MPFVPTESLEEALWDQLMNVNLKSVFLGSKYVIPVMKKQGGGTIINTASISGVRPRPAMSAYGTSKGAVITFTKALAIELAPQKIRVNCINPVVIDTPFLNKNFDSSKLEEAKRFMLATIPLGRLGKPDDIANAALYRHQMIRPWSQA
jgi:3-oxoacyl-[acyl-carrier protein] reductase